MSIVRNERNDWVPNLEVQHFAIDELNHNDVTTQGANIKTVLIDSETYYTGTDETGMQTDAPRHNPIRVDLKIDSPYDLLHMCW